MPLCKVKDASPLDRPLHDFFNLVIMWLRWFSLFFKTSLLNFKVTVRPTVLPCAVTSLKRYVQTQVEI